MCKEAIETLKKALEEDFYQANPGEIQDEIDSTEDEEERSYLQEEFSESTFWDFHAEDQARTTIAFLVVDVVKENADFSFFTQAAQKAFGDKYEPKANHMLDFGSAILPEFKQFVQNFKGDFKIGGRSTPQNKPLIEKAIKYYEKNLNSSFNDWMYEYHVCEHDLKQVYDAFTPENFHAAMRLAEHEIDWIHDITPDDISELVKQILEQTSGDSVLDLCSGEGNFLINYANSDETRNYKYAGVELCDSRAMFSSIILKLSGIDAKIETGDIFNFDFKNQKFDKIFCEPSFGVTLSSSTKNRIIKKSAFDFPVATSPEWFYLSIGIQRLAESGKLVAILPSGILSNIRDSDFRAQLIESGLIEAIIQLPSDVLQGTKISTSLIVLSHNNRSIKFINASHCANKNSNAAKYRTKNSSLDVAKIMQLVKGAETKLSQVVSNQDLSQSKSSLLPERFTNKNLSLQELPNQKSLQEISEKIFRGIQFTQKERENLDADATEKHVAKLVTATNISCGKVRGSYKKIKDDSKRFEKFYLEDGDIVVSARGSSVKSGVVEIKNDELMIPANGVVVIRLKDPNDAFYICCYLESEVGQTLLSEVQTGTALKLLNASALQNLRIPFPTKIMHKNYINRKFKDNVNMLYSLETQVQQIEHENKHIFDGLCGLGA